MVKKVKGAINLLDPMQPPQETFTILYNWVFGIGKFLLIVVQVVVLGVFGARLYFDRINNDLGRDINEKVAMLSQPEVEEDEEFFRRLHKLFDDLYVLDSGHVRNTSKIISVIESISTRVNLQNFNFNNYSVSSSFTANSFEDVRLYENFLKRNPNYYDVNLSLTKSGDEDGEIEFNVSYKLKMNEIDYY